MLILGIDPGPKASGYVAWDGKAVTFHTTASNEIILAWLHQRAVESVVAIEWIVGYGMTVGSETFDTCRWVGRFEQAAGEAHLMTRKAIKLRLCGNLQARDQHVRQALIDRIGPQGTKKAPGPTHGISGHEWAALAVAVCWADQYGEQAP